MNLKNTSNGRKASQKKGFTPTPQLGVISRVSFKIQRFIKTLAFSGNFLNKSQRYKNTTPSLVSGFTLIELLTSIAIIGILAAIIITSLSSSRIKANDTKIKAQLSRFRSAAELYFDNQNPIGYGPTTSSCSSGLFGSTSTSDGNPNSYINIANLPGTPAVVCGAVNNAYAVKIESPEGGYWCVDSTNRLIKISGSIGSPVTVCP